MDEKTQKILDEWKEDKFDLANDREFQKEQEAIEEAVKMPGAKELLSQDPTEETITKFAKMVSEAKKMIELSERK